MEIDRSALELKLGDYATGPSTVLPNPRWLGQAQTYRRSASARMIPLDKRGMKMRMPNQDFHVSRKIDGEFTLLIYEDGEVVTINPGATVRTGLPFMEEAAKLIKATKAKGTVILAGELHVKRDDGKRARVHDVSRVARKPESDADLERLHFAVFDIVEWNGKEPPKDYDSVWETIESAFEKGERIQPVETVILNSAKEVEAQFEEWVNEEGAEGLVARSDAAGTFKVKPRHSIDAVAIGFAESVDDRAGLLHDILLALVRADGSYQILGRVGGGFSEDDRRNLLSDFQDIEAESDYAEINSDRVAYQMVKPDKVVEISCLDIIAESTRGASIDRMTLKWDAKKKCWHSERRLPLVSIISPEFERIRDDKKASAEHTGLSQLTGIVEIADTDKSVEDLKYPESTVLKREVYTKELKGKRMVRKLVLWKTNKEDVSDIHPAYVLHYTDFSPNRKSPLDREVRLSSSKEQIESFWTALHEKAFVRGWKPLEE